MIEIKGIIGEYLSEFPEERARLRQLTDFVDSGDAPQLFDRGYARGHITASAFIISPDREEVLLVHHRGLDAFLQPGGHLEPSDRSPLSGALREVKEETGITALRQVQVNSHDLVPLDIDIHHIPANNKKSEPGHYHYDFRYLFVSRTRDISPSAEIAGWRWVNISALPYDKIVEKIQCALSKEQFVVTFYDKVIACLDVNLPLDTLVIAHFIPDVIPYLEALSQISNIVAIIPKPRSLIPEVKTRICRRFPVSDLSRDSIAGGALSLMLANSRRLVLLDIGGYFASVVSVSKQGGTPGLLGIVEDTENGHQKYLSLDNDIVPIVSVARSPLKAIEDFLVGQSVVFSADAVLRDLGYLFQYLRIGILGFGKVGRSILQHTMQRNIVPMVYDSNPINRLDARSQGAHIPARQTFIAEVELIFSATGNRALTIEDFTALKSGCFIFSVTSSDDEMDLSRLSTRYTIRQESRFVIKLTGDRNYFYLINGGNAVNFLHKAVLGDFIHLVRAEMLFAIEALSRGRAEGGIQEVDSSVRTTIASIWLETYRGK
jgi:adenosylhomocysteinase